MKVTSDKGCFNFTIEKGAVIFEERSFESYKVFIETLRKEGHKIKSVEV